MFTFTVMPNDVQAATLRDLTDSQRQELATRYVENGSFNNQTTVVEYILSCDDRQSAPFTREDIANDTPTGEVEINGEWLHLTEEERDDKLELFEHMRDRAQTVFEEADCKRCDMPQDTTKEEALYNVYDSRVDNFESDVLNRLITDCEALEGLECETYPEVYQWFEADSWTIRQLTEAGEVTLDGTYWGRQCCGQAICLDHVIQQLAFDTFKVEV